MPPASLDEKLEQLTRPPQDLDAKLAQLTGQPAPPPPDPSVFHTLDFGDVSSRGRDVEAPEPPGLLRFLSEAVEQSVKGFVDLPGGLAQGLGAASNLGDRLLHAASSAPLELMGVSTEHARPGDAQDNAIFEMGTRIRQFADELFEEDEAFRGSFFAQTLPRGFGQMAGFVATGGLSSAAGVPAFLSTSLLGAGINAADGYLEAKARGASETKALEASGLYGLIGTTEALPLERILGRVLRVSGGRGAIREALKSASKSAIEEGLQEAGQNVANDIAARTIFDPDREIDLSGAGEAGAAGSTIGGVTNLFMKLAGTVLGRRLRMRARAADIIQKQPDVAEKIASKETPTRSDVQAVPKSERPTSARERQELAKAIKKERRRIRGGSRVRRPGDNLGPPVEGDIITPGQPVVSPNEPNIETQVAPARPDLANPAITPPVRDLVDDADRQMVAEGLPRGRSDAEVAAEAEQRLRADPNVRERLIRAASEGAVFDEADTVLAKRVIQQEGEAALMSGDVQQIRAAQDLMRAYRTEGRAAGNQFRLRRDSVETPEQRRKRLVVEALFEPSEKVRRKMLRRELASVGPLTSAMQKSLEAVRDEAAQDVANSRDKLKALGVDPAKLSELAKDPVATAKVLNAIAASKARAWDVAMEWWRNSILSGPKTQAANVAGNTVFAMLNAAERLGEAMANTLVRNPNAAQFGEFKHALAGFLPGIGRGAVNFWRSFDSETPFFENEIRGGKGGLTKLDAGDVAIEGGLGRVVRLPQRLLVAADEFAKTSIATMDVQTQAYRIAKQEGLSSEALTQRIANLVKDTDSKAWENALNTAREMTFQKPLGAGGQLVLNAREAFPVLRFFIPFVTTPANIFKEGIKRTPLGGLQLLGVLRSGDTTQLPRILAQQTLAWGVLAAFLWLNDDDDPFITGTVTTRSRGARDAAFRGELPEQSIRIGDKWFSYSRIEPFATTLALIADWTRAMRSGSQVKKTEAPIQSIIGQLRNKTFLSGIADIMRALEADSPADQVAQWGSKFAASWVPNLVREVGRARQSTFQQRRIWGDGPERTTRIINRTLQKTELGVVEDMPAIDFWGQTIDRTTLGGSPTSDFLYRLMVPVQVRDARLAKAPQMLLNWNSQNPDDERFPELPRPTYKDPETKEQRFFTDEQYNRLLQLAGAATLRLTELEITDRAASNPTIHDIETLESARDAARKAVRNALIAEIKGGPRTDLDSGALADFLHRENIIRKSNSLAARRPLTRSGAERWAENLDAALNWFEQRGVTPDEARSIYLSHLRRTTRGDDRQRRINERFDRFQKQIVKVQQ